jgi:trans-aconitate 2-methyltransferase
MGDWKPELYLKFEKQRTQPAIDLVSRIDLSAPKRIIDIGCGPGNSTLALKNRWSNAMITGLDSSPAMIAQASKTDRDIQWVCADASSDLSGLGKFDIVFSNAAIQWMPDHDKLLPNLFSLLESGGMLAVQVPNTTKMPVQTALDSLVHSERWRARLSGESSHSSFSAPYYYDVLSALSRDVDLWETHYYHVMENHHSIVQWYSSTGLRPYLNRLDNESDQEEFLTEFQDALKVAYPIQNDGSVLFPFTRIFFLARKG